MGVKFFVNERFFDTWSPKMAYILGYICADGSMERSHSIRGWYIRIGSTEKDRVMAIKKAMRSQHKINVRQRPGHHKTYYLLRIGNKTLYTSLERYGIKPRKSLTIRCPQVPREYIGDFVRGYLDGDGCVHIEKGIGLKGQKIIKRIAVIFTCGSKMFLEDLNGMLQEIGLPKKEVYRNGRAYKLRYGSNNCVDMFALLYGSNIEPDLRMKRKYETFKKYFKMRPQRINDKIGAILEK